MLWTMSRSVMCSGETRQPDAAADATAGVHEPRAVQLGNDAAGEGVGDLQLAAQAAGRDALAAGPAGQLGEDADGVVGAPRDFRCPSRNL